MSDVAIGIVSGIVGIVTGYVSGLLQQLAERRSQLTEALADYYSAAANLYYAWAELETNKTRSDRWQHLYEQYVKYYELFLKNSTKLFSLTPPAWGDEVLRMEDLWEQIENPTDSAGEALWFERLDRLREKLLPLIRNRLLEPTKRTPLRLLTKFLNRALRAGPKSR